LFFSSTRPLLVIFYFYFNTLVWYWSVVLGNFK
jgi:hypothetical protein